MIGAGLATIIGKGSRLVQTAISFGLCIADVISMPCPSQPKPMARKVNSMARLKVMPPAMPARSVLNMATQAEG
jgi:hypothetical protein